MGSGTCSVPESRTLVEWWLLKFQRERKHVGRFKERTNYLKIKLLCTYLRRSIVVRVACSVVDPSTDCKPFGHARTHAGNAGWREIGLHPWIHLGLGESQKHKSNGYCCFRVAHLKKKEKKLFTADVRRQEQWQRVNARRWSWRWTYLQVTFKSRNDQCWIGYRFCGSFLLGIVKNVTILRSDDRHIAFRTAIDFIGCWYYFLWFWRPRKHL